MSSITPEFLKKKAREISYALNRVSFYIKRDELRNRLERLSFEFLENAAVAGEDASDKQSLIKVFKNISALDVLVRIGHSLYEIETVNSNILIRELDSFSVSLREISQSETIRQSGLPTRDLVMSPPDPLRSGTKRDNSAMGNNSEFGKPNLESIFSMPPAVIKETVNGTSVSVGVKKEFGNKQQSDNSVSLREISSCLRQIPCEAGQSGTVQSSAKDKQASESKDFANIDNEKDIVERAYSKDTNGITQSPYERCPEGTQVRDESGNRTIRQDLISEKIRQSGKANVRTLINQFPGVSERTLRYDLQRLCDQGVVEKIGSSGPGTSYIPKNLTK